MIWDAMTLIWRHGNDKVWNVKMVKTFLISFYVNGKLMAQYNYGSCMALKSLWNIFGGQFFATISWFYRPSTAPKCAILYTSTVLPTPDKLTFSALGGTGWKWMNRGWDQFLLYWIYMKGVLFIIYAHQDMPYLFENKVFFNVIKLFITMTS